MGPDALPDERREGTPSPEETARRIASVLRREDLSPAWRRLASAHSLSGHCYVASEALWHALGGPASPWRPRVAREDSETHWWLQAEGRILDPTAAQFTDMGLVLPYHLGRGCGFLTRRPSRRARTVLERAGLAVPRDRMS